MKWKDFQVPMTKEEHHVTCCNSTCRIISCIRSPAGCQTEKYPGILLAAATLGVFGWFTVMTVVTSGYPTAH